jgi:hypothetical protein
MFKSKLDDYVIAIEKARESVAAAAENYSKGGSLERLTKAQRELADAHERARECYGLRVPDKR